MFKRQNLNIPLHKGGFLTPQKAAEVITRAFQMTSVGFEFVQVDKPQEGTLFLFASAPGSIEIPEDGYGWMDLEEYSKTKLENGMEVEIFTRNMGFGLNESQALVKRKRFRLVQHGDLQLLHYIRVPEGPQINPTMIKTRPRMVQGPRVMSPAAVNVPGQMTPQQVQQYNQRLEQQRKLLKMRQPPPVRILEDEKDPSGDEMDKNFGRILSLERYKRNHNLIEALFAPNSISKLEKPFLFADVSKEKLETLKQMQAELEEELEIAKKENLKLIQDYKTKSKSEWKQIHDLKVEFRKTRH